MLYLLVYLALPLYPSTPNQLLNKSVGYGTLQSLCLIRIAQHRVNSMSNLPGMLSLNPAFITHFFARTIKL